MAYTYQGFLFSAKDSQSTAFNHGLVLALRKIHYLVPAADNSKDIRHSLFLAESGPNILHCSELSLEQIAKVGFDKIAGLYSVQVQSCQRRGSLGLQLLEVLELQGIHQAGSLIYTSKEQGPLANAKVLPSTQR